MKRIVASRGLVNFRPIVVSLADIGRRSSGTFAVNDLKAATCRAERAFAFEINTMKKNQPVKNPEVTFRANIALQK